MVSTRTQSSTIGLKPIWLRVRDASYVSGLSRSHLFRLIASGDIESIKVGRARLVSVEAIKKLGAGRDK